MKAIGDVLLGAMITGVSLLALALGYERNREKFRIRRQLNDKKGRSGFDT